MSPVIIFIGMVALAYWLANWKRRGNSDSTSGDEQSLRTELEAKIRRADAIYDAYVKLLQEEGPLYQPESVLPFPKNEIKAALLQVLAFQRFRGGITDDQVQAVKNGYITLSKFVPDQHARPYASLHQTVRTYGNSDLDDDTVLEAARQIAAVYSDGSADAAAEYAARATLELAREFDTRWSATLRVANE